MKTMKRFLALLLFFVAAMNVQTLSAQTNGDVNNDGSVNEADISAIIEIMKEANGVGPKKYYWYAGWTVPTEANIATIINEEYPVSKTDATSNKAGGYSNTNSGYNVNNLFASITTNRYNIADTNRENSGILTNYYIVVPNNMGIYSTNLLTMSVLSTFTKHSEFNNHIVYKSNDTSRNIRAFAIY